MTLKEYYQALTEFIETYPNTLNLQVIYSKDDEGNGYNTVQFGASIVQIEDIESSEIELVGFYEEGENNIALEDCNAVVIN